jgi:2-polyprenyl-3-methyl-5-hydroxy-6-metoxy-1,4-benzoquinol methylase
MKDPSARAVHKNIIRAKFCNSTWAEVAERFFVAKLSSKLNFKRRHSLPTDVLTETDQYDRDVASFNEYISQFDVTGLDKFFWYHVVDLGNGVVTPGDYDYRSSIEAFGFPADMRGMRVLDVGSATGFFAFEFERRGADVYSVELPSLLDWDMIASERDTIVRSLMEYHRVSTPEDVFWCHLNGPFQFCRQRLNSSVKRVFSTVYELRPALFDGHSFDLIFLGDILLHLFSPLQALNAVAPLCRHKLIVASDVIQLPRAAAPLLYFIGSQKATRTHGGHSPAPASSRWSFGSASAMLLMLGITLE